MSERSDDAREIAELRQAKAALEEALAASRKSEEQFRTMLSSIPTLVWRTSAEGSAEFFSQRWCDYTGISFENAQGAGWTAAFHPDDLVALSAKWMEIVASKKPRDVEARFRRHDGEYRWHLMRSVPLFDDQGEVVNWCGTNTDITDQTVAKDALEKALAEVSKSEERFRTIIDTIPGLVWGTGPDGAANYLNRPWLGYTGLSREQAEGMGWTVAVHPDDIGTLYEQWMRIVASKKPGEVEARLRRVDGEYRWFLFRGAPYCDGLGNILGWYGTNTDIDDLKRAETLLAGEKRLFEMVATGYSLSETLTTLCQVVEELAEGSIASILLMDEEGKRLRHGAAPSLEPSYLEGIDGGLIGPEVGSCGTAAYLREKVFSPNIAADPRWKDYADHALKHDLRACFSFPIFSSEARVLGTFAFYAKQARSISPLEHRLADQFTHLASILIERKLAEDALKKSEALLAEGQRISKTGSWVWNVSGGVVVWSEEHCRIFGFDPNQLNVSLESYLQSVHPSDLTRVRAVLDDAVRRDCEFSIEYRINLSDGSMKHIHSRGRPIASEHGRSEEFIGTAMDINYRYEAKLALENALANAVASEDQLRTLIDTMPGLAWTAGPNGEAEFLSRGWLDYTGMAKEEAQGSGWANAIHPDDVGPMVETWQKIIASKKSGDQERRLRRFDGVYRWFLFRGAPLLDQKGHVVKWYGVNIDIDDQRHSEEEMRKLVSLIENSTDYIGYARSPKEVTYMNGAWRQIAGLPPDANLSHYQFADFLSPLEYHRFNEEIAPILDRDGHWEGERSLRNIETDFLTPVHQDIFFITEADTGRRIGIATICRDITERKRAEDELRRSEADLRKAHSELAHVTRVTTMGELAASIAHEVNQPIAGVVINGNACMRWLSRLQEDPATLAEARAALQRIIRDGTRAGEVIARIRALFKKTETAKGPLEINEVIREVIVLARSEMDKRRVALQLALAPDLPPVLGDRVQLQQVLLNLILNGIEAMSMIEDRPRELRIETQKSNDTGVLVSVRDGGVGLDPANNDQIFAAFHTTKPGGLGMGLSISRSIVENHNGRLWATANDGPGATFQFTLITDSHQRQVEAR